MLTPKQKRFLESLHGYLKKHQEHSFVLQVGKPGNVGRLVLSFPYGSGLKGELDKDHRNFDYKIDALFNHKLRQAMWIVIYFSSRFPDATEQMKDLVLRELHRNKEQKRRH